MRQELTTLLGTIKPADAREDKPELAVCVLVVRSILDLARFVTAYDKPAGETCVGIWIEETGFIDVRAGYVYAVLDEHGFDAEYAVQQLMIHGWLDVLYTEDLGIVEGVRQKESILRVDLDMALSDCKYFDGQLIIDDGDAAR